MPKMAMMIKNVFVSGQIHVLFVPNEEDFDDDYNLFEALQAQAERIELLEEQNQVLLRQERILLRLLELSSQTGRAITDSLMELKNILNDESDAASLQELARRLETKIPPETSKP